DRLDRVEPARPAFALVLVLRPLPVLAQRLRGLREPGVVRGQRARVAKGAEVLARIEAERRERAFRAGADAVPIRSVCLAGVLDELQPAAVGELEERAHVGHLAV